MIKYIEEMATIKEQLGDRFIFVEKEFNKIVEAILIANKYDEFLKLFKEEKEIIREKNRIGGDVDYIKGKVAELKKIEILLNSLDNSEQPRESSSEMFEALGYYLNVGREDYIKFSKSDLSITIGKGFVEKEKWNKMKRYMENEPLTELELQAVNQVMKEKGWLK